jgi:hypothetical protein
MRTRQYLAGMAVVTALLAVRPGSANAATDLALVRRLEARIGDTLRAVGRDLLVLTSAGYVRAGMWKEATVVSRVLVSMAGDASQACVAQAAVAWQASEVSYVGGVAFSEWGNLRRLVEDVERDEDASSADRRMCEDAYRRVTGHLVVVWHRTTDLDGASLQQLQGLYAAYGIAVQQRVAAAGAAPRR